MTSCLPLGGIWTLSAVSCLSTGWVVNVNLLSVFLVVVEYSSIKHSAASKAITICVLGNLKAHLQ